MLDAEKIFSLGGPYIIVKVSEAEHWYGATSETSIQYDRLLEFINHEMPDHQIHYVLNTIIDNIPILTIVNSSIVYKVSDHSFFQVEAVSSSEVELNKQTFNLLKNFQPDHIHAYDINLEQGNYYIFDSAWEFSEIKSDKNFFEITLNENMNTLVVSYYSTQNFDGWLIEFN